MSQAYIWDLTRRLRKGKKVQSQFGATMWNATLWGRVWKEMATYIAPAVIPTNLQIGAASHGQAEQKGEKRLSHQYLIPILLQQSDKCLSALARMKWNQIVVHLPLNPTCEDGRIVSYPSLNLFLEWVLWSRIPVALGGFPSLVTSLITEATTSLCNLAGLLQNVRKPSQSNSRFIQDTFHAKVKNSPLLKQDESPFLIQLVLTLCPNHLWSGFDPASSHNWAPKPKKRHP